MCVRARACVSVCVKHGIASLVASNQLAVCNSQQVCACMCQSTACVCVFLCVCASTAYFRSDGGGRGGRTSDDEEEMGLIQSKGGAEHKHANTIHTHTQKRTGDHKTDAAKRVLLVPSNCSLFQAMMPKLRVSPEPLPMHLLLLLD